MGVVASVLVTDKPQVMEGPIIIYLTYPTFHTSSADVEGNLSMAHNRVAASVRLPEAMTACST